MKGIPSLLAKEQWEKRNGMSLLEAVLEYVGHVFAGLSNESPLLQLPEMEEDVLAVLNALRRDVLSPKLRKAPERIVEMAFSFMSTCLSEKFPKSVVDYCRSSGVIQAVVSCLSANISSEAVCFKGVQLIRVQAVHDTIEDLVGSKIIICF